jgi:signal transduction histidine kinase/CheY-like chemotaxis protein
VTICSSFVRCISLRLPAAMQKLSTYWNTFINRGCLPHHTETDRQQRILLNVVWLIAVIAYVVYFFIVQSVFKGNNTILYVSAAWLVLLFLLVQFAVETKRHNAAKIGLLLGINAGIFFYDNFIGASAGVHFYYIPFIFTAVFLFSFAEERAATIFFAVLPLALYGISHLNSFSIFGINSHNETVATWLYPVNFSISILLVVFYGIYSSIAKRYNELSLIQSKINLQTLIDNTQGSIWSVSRNYNIIAANQLYKDDMKMIFGATVIPGYNLMTIIESSGYPEQWKKQYQRVFNGESFNDEYVFNNDIFELQAVPIHSTGGIVVGAAFYARNISLRKQYEKEIINAREKAEQASVAKAQFLSNMSHELRTPLNGIVGLSNILLSEKILPEQKEYLNTLHYSASHMIQIVDDILDYNKIDAGKLELEKEPFNMAALLSKMRHIFRNQATKKGLEFEVVYSDALNRNVLGDITRLQQVLNNLLGNAIKFTNRGFVKFEVAIRQQTGDNTCLLDFVVSDSGIGIPQSRQADIFESFTQADVRTNRKYGGTGLGLTISKKLVALMGGALKVQSVHGVGSTFSFCLEFECSKEEAVIEKPATTIDSFSSFSNIKILVAEDNKINMMVACNMLGKWGATIAMAENGAEAIDLFTKTNFDLILMDLEMPVMDGWTAIERIKKSGVNVPVIALTASSYEGLEEDLNKKGFAGYVQKPFQPAALHQKIADHIAKKTVAAD